MICTAIAASSIDIYLPALPELVKYFDTTDNILKFSILVSPVISAFTGLFYGSLSDMYGRRIIFLFCLFVFTIGSLWCSFSDSAVEFLIARIVQAVGSTGMGMLTVNILADKFRGITFARYLSFYSLLYPLTFAIAPNIGAFLMLKTSWKGLFILLAILGIILNILIFYMLPETLNKNSQVSQPYLSLNQWLKTIYKMITGNKIFRSMVLTNTLSVSINQIFITNAPFVFERYFGFNEIEYANLLIIPHIFNIAGCLLYSFALKYTTPKKCMTFGSIIISIFLLASAVEIFFLKNISVIAVISIYCICSFGMSFLIMTSFGFAISALQTDKGLGNGISQFVRNISYSLIVLVSGCFFTNIIQSIFFSMCLCGLAVISIICYCYKKLPEID